MDENKEMALDEIMKTMETLAESTKKCKEDLSSIPEEKENLLPQDEIDKLNKEIESRQRIVDDLNGLDSRSPEEETVLTDSSSKLEAAKKQIEENTKKAEDLAVKETTLENALKENNNQMDSIIQSLGQDANINDYLQKNFIAQYSIEKSKVSTEKTEYETLLTDLEDKIKNDPSLSGILDTFKTAMGEYDKAHEETKISGRSKENVAALNKASSELSKVRKQLNSEFKKHIPKGIDYDINKELYNLATYGGFPTLKAKISSFDFITDKLTESHTHVMDLLQRSKEYGVQAKTDYTPQIDTLNTELNDNNVKIQENNNIINTNEIELYGVDKDAVQNAYDQANAELIVIHDKMVRIDEINDELKTVDTSAAIADKEQEISDKEAELDRAEQLELLYKNGIELDDKDLETLYGIDTSTTDIKDTFYVFMEKELELRKALEELKNGNCTEDDFKKVFDEYNNASNNLSDIEINGIKLSTKDWHNFLNVELRERIKNGESLDSIYTEDPNLKFEQAKGNIPEGETDTLKTLEDLHTANTDLREIENKLFNGELNSDGFIASPEYTTYKTHSSKLLALLQAKDNTIASLKSFFSSIPAKTSGFFKKIGNFFKKRLNKPKTYMGNLKYDKVDTATLEGDLSSLEDDKAILEASGGVSDPAKVKSLNDELDQLKNDLLATDTTGHEDKKSEAEAKLNKFADIETLKSENARLTSKNDIISTDIDTLVQKQTEQASSIKNSEQVHALSDKDKKTVLDAVEKHLNDDGR